MVAPGQGMNSIPWHKFPDLDELCFLQYFPVTYHNTFQIHLFRQSKIGSTPRRVSQAVNRDGDEAGRLPVELRQYYLNRPTLDMEGDPLQQWEVLKSEFPNLYRVALRFIPLTARSVAAERLSAGRSN